MEDLNRQIDILDSRIQDTAKFAAVREGKLNEEISSLKTQIEMLKTYQKNLDKCIQKIALVHSQLTALPNYKLSRSDVDEVIRLVSNL